MARRRTRKVRERELGGRKKKEEERERERDEYQTMTLERQIPASRNLLAGLVASESSAP